MKWPGPPKILKRRKRSGNSWRTSAGNFRPSGRRKRKPCAARRAGKAPTPGSPFDAKRLTAQAFGRMLPRDYEGPVLEFDFAAQTQARDLGGWGAVDLHLGRFPNF